CPGLAAGVVGGGRTRAGRGGPRPVHRDRAVPGHGWQDLEPPGAGRRHSAGAQRAGDGRVPVVPAWRLTHAISPPPIYRSAPAPPRPGVPLTARPTAPSSST